MTSLLWRDSLRYLRRRPWQFALAVLGIALGTAVVIAIELTTSSARRAFDLAADTVSGHATHRIVGGPQGVPEIIYRDLRLTHNLRSVAPVVEGTAVIPGPQPATVNILGIDPFADRDFRPALRQVTIRGANTLTALLTGPPGGLLTQATANRFDLIPGQSVTIRVGGVYHPVTLVGIVTPPDGAAREGLADILITDIAVAQALLNMPGRLSRIDLILRDDAHAQMIRALLPSDLALISAGAHTRAVSDMGRAFHLNLTAMSLLALLVGIFLIYNTMTFSVVQRRRHIGLLRAIGVTRREIFTRLQGEALIIGIIGSALGLLLGVLLGQGLLQMVTRTINDHYFAVTVRDLYLSPWLLIKGGALGIGATLCAAAVPAWEASTAPASAVLNRSTEESRLRAKLPLVTGGGLTCICMGALILVLPSRDLVLAYTGIFSMILGCALMAPAGTVLLARVVQPVIAWRGGVIGRMAVRGIVANLSRTAVAVSALMIAIAATISVGIMVHSFRQTVIHWLDTTLQADIYVAAPSARASRGVVTLDPDLLARIETLPGVERVNTYRGVSVESESGVTRLAAIRVSDADAGTFRFRQGNPVDAWHAFRNENAVLISEPYAYRNRLAVGDGVELRTDRGLHTFLVAGVYADYGAEQGVVMMTRETYDQFWGDRAVSSLAVFVAPGAALNDVLADIRGFIDPRRRLLVRSNRTLRDLSLEVFDRTFAITNVLSILATIIAFIGVLSALLAMQLERAREMAVLRANGLTPAQVYGLVTAQTGLIGAIAGLLALPVGILLSGLLIFVINRRSFGWTMQMDLDPGILLQALALGICAALLAGLWPAFTMARAAPALALREE